MNEHRVVLRERARYLEQRIAAKKGLGWETCWDEREQAALEWAIDCLDLNNYLAEEHYQTLKDILGKGKAYTMRK